MNFVIPAILSTFLALVYSKEFELNKPNNITGKSIPFNNDVEEFYNYVATLDVYTVLLIQEHNSYVKGTGLLVKIDRLITPAKNLENSNQGIIFNLNPKLNSSEKRRIISNCEFDGPLSVANFEPAIEEAKKDLIPQLPIFTPRNTPMNIKMMSIGFTRSKVFQKKIVEVQGHVENWWQINLNLDNPPHIFSYFVRIGDVLVTHQMVMGFLIHYKIKDKKVVGKYYYPTYAGEIEF